MSDHPNPDRIEDLSEIDWDNFESNWSAEAAKTLSRNISTRFGRLGDVLEQEQQRKLYRAKFPDRELKQLPEEQDYVERTDPRGNVQRLKRCQATAKQTGKRCRQMARKGHDYCWLHGAGTKDNPGGLNKYLRPIYDTDDKDNDILRRAERFLNDERLDDIDDEMAIQKALQERLIDRFEEEDDISEKTLLKVSKDITSTWKKKKDVEANYALSVKELNKLITTLKTSLEQHVGPEAQEKVINDIKGALQ